jgi:hypothetical protein
MAKTIGRLPGYDAADIERILTSLRWVIVRTLEESMIYRLDDRNTLVGAGEYESFVSVLQQLIRQHRPSLSVAIITFNYDVALELALLREHIPFNYGIQDEDGQADRKTVRVLKLHGSLNWATTGQKIRVWPISDIATYDGVREYRGSGAPILRIGSEIQKYFAGSVTVDETPALVPPTWNKGAAGSDLAKVWRSAAAELATAEHVYLVGYSIPNTDQFFPYLFALGTAGGKPFRQIAVLDPDANVQQRFRGLLGPGAVASFLPLGSIWFNSVPTQLKGIFGLN